MTCGNVGYARFGVALWPGTHDMLTARCRTLCGVNLRS
jgi:hypothetical protein